MPGCCIYTRQKVILYYAYQFSVGLQTMRTYAVIHDRREVTKCYSGLDFVLDCIDSNFARYLQNNKIV